MKKKWLISSSLILIALIVSVWAFVNYPIWQAQKVAEQYVLSWSSGNTLDDFTQSIRSVSTDYFIKNQLSSEIAGYRNRIKLNTHDTNSIVKTYVIDRHPTAVETVSYYNEYNPDKKYSVPMQANLILFKEKGTWKIQNSYILRRSYRPIPPSTKSEESNQTSRYEAISAFMDKFIVSINQKTAKAYLSYFISGQDNSKYQTGIDKLPYTNLKIAGVYDLSSSDAEMYPLVVLMAEKDGKPSSLTLNCRLIVTKDGLKVQNLMFAQ